MPALTRRRDPDRPNCWQIYYGDVRVGTIGERSGVPKHQNQWGWDCGFFPGGPKSKGGDGPDFETCRQAFRRAWDAMLPALTEANFEEWRDHRDVTAWKYRMHDLRLPLPTQSTKGRSRCFCGAEITIAGMDQHVSAAHRGIGA